MPVPRFDRLDVVDHDSERQSRTSVDRITFQSEGVTWIITPGMGGSFRVEVDTTDPGTRGMSILPLDGKSVVFEPRLDDVYRRTRTLEAKEQGQPVCAVCDVPLVKRRTPVGNWAHENSSSPRSTIPVWHYARTADELAAERPE